MKKSFFNDTFCVLPAGFGIFIILMLWIVYAVSLQQEILIVVSIITVCFSIWLIFVVWTGRLTRITVYADRIKWIRHFKSRIICVEDIKIKDVLPVRRYDQWCIVIINDNDNDLYMGLANSRHMAKLIDILQPSKLKVVLEEEKKKRDDW